MPLYHQFVYWYLHYTPINQKQVWPRILYYIAQVPPTDLVTFTQLAMSGLLEHPEGSCIHPSYTHHLLPQTAVESVTLMPVMQSTHEDTHLTSVSTLSLH